MQNLSCCCPVFRRFLNRESLARFGQPVSWYSKNKKARIELSAEQIRERLLRMQRELKKKTPCYLRVRRSEFKCLAYQEIKVDPCHPDECAVPIDVEEYAPSDKLERSYQRTWGEFKTLPRRQPKIRKIYPEPQRRDPVAFRGKLCTACEPEDCELPKSPRAPPPRLFTPTTRPWPCCRQRNPSCRANKRHGRCYRGRPPSCCTKRGTPYLSFSECKKFPLQPPISPCECDMKPSMCDVWNFYRIKN